MTKFDLYFSPEDGAPFQKVRVSAIRLPDGSVYDGNGWRTTSEAKEKSEDWLTAFQAAIPVPLEYGLKISANPHNNELQFDYYSMGQFHATYYMTPGDTLSIKGIPTIDDVPIANWEIGYEK